jgi:hypothetical protein
MQTERIPKSADDIARRLIELAEKNYNCSQIMMILALDQEGRQNPELVRAMSGLGDGCGFFKETCGGIIFQTYGKVNEILAANNFI